ncbi:MAG: glycosyltransferase family 39 protein [Gammaproteobacteria bacterium]
MLSNKPLLQSTRLWLTDLISLTILLSLFYAVWIGSYALFTPDEGRYSEVAREMIVTGDYITPRLNGVVFLDKPILYYWLQACAMKLFGVKEWALRFWPALAGILGCLITYITGHLLFNRRTGIISALILATSPLYYGAAHYANLDLEVATLVGNSLLCFIAGMQVENQKLKNILLICAYVFAGLAALTKGLIGIAFPAMIIGAWILALNRWDTLKKMRLVSGLLIFTAIALPWYVLVQKANPEFFEFFFMKQQISRFLTTDHFNNRTPGWFYIPIVLAGAFPWCIFLIQALVQQTKTVLRNRKDHPVELFLLLWFFLIFIFFSIPKSKTVGYILPIFPALALLTGHYLSNRWDDVKSKGIKTGILTFIALCLGIIGACIALPQIKSFELEVQLIPYMRICIVLFFVSGLATILLYKKKLPQLFTIIAMTAVSFLLLVAASAVAINQKTIKPLAVVIKPHLQPNDEVVAFYKYFQDLPIYLERRITIVADWTATDIPLKDNWVRELWYGMPFQDTKDWLINEKLFWERWNGDKRLFVFTHADFYPEMKKKSKIEVYKIAQYNQTVLLSNRPSS